LRELDEVCAAEGTGVRFGGVGKGKEMRYLREWELDPWVGICVREEGEEEVLIEILDEVRSSFRMGLG
jgi:hypothetical protein